jgi:CBS domain-containing protein
VTGSSTTRREGGRGRLDGRDDWVSIPPPGDWTVLHTRGAGVRRIAELLATGTPHRIRGDLHTAAAETGADLLVARHLTSSALLPQVVPHHVDASKVTSVVGAIGTGPHGAAVAAVSARLASVLDVPGRLVAASSSAGHDPAAAAALDRSGSAAPGLDRSVQRVSDVTDVVRAMSPNAVLVLGAPGGSWLQRQFFGPGRKLTVHAPGGVLLLRDAPVRCFQRLDEWRAFGPQMRVADVLGVLTSAAAPIVVQGRVVGIVRRSRLEKAPAGATAGTVMEAPVSIRWDSPVSAAREISERLDNAPVPVVGPDERLIGEIRPPDGATAAPRSHR